MHTVQQKNSFINCFRKRSISPRKCNANDIHSREIETLLKTSAKFVDTRAGWKKSDVSKMLASEKAESWLISFASTWIHFVAECVGTWWFMLDVSVHHLLRPDVTRLLIVKVNSVSKYKRWPCSTYILNRVNWIEGNVKNSDQGGNWTHNLRVRSPPVYRLSSVGRPPEI